MAEIVVRLDQRQRVSGLIPYMSHAEKDCGESLCDRGRVFFTEHKTLPS
jgi:hypothetical protein